MSKKIAVEFTPEQLIHAQRALGQRRREFRSAADKPSYDAIMDAWLTTSEAMKAHDEALIEQGNAKAAELEAEAATPTPKEPAKPRRNTRKKTTTTTTTTGKETPNDAA